MLRNTRDGNELAMPLQYLARMNTIDWLRMHWCARYHYACRCAGTLARFLEDRNFVALLSFAKLDIAYFIVLVTFLLY